MKNILSFLFLLFSTAAFSQHNYCGTVHDLESLRQMNEFAAKTRAAADGNLANRKNEVVWLPVTYHVLRKSDGTSGVDIDKLYDMHCRLNYDYTNYDIQFYMFPQIEYIDNTDLYNNTDFESLVQYKNTESVNIFIGNTLNFVQGCTVGCYIPSNDLIYISKVLVKYDEYTISHEVGHFLSLLHTFNGWESLLWYFWSMENPDECAPESVFSVLTELQSGVNCENAGDFICDTPPDFGFLSEYYDCEFDEEFCDAEGAIVAPMVNNMMGYMIDCFDFVFTPTQVDLMLTNIDSRTSLYLNGQNNTNEVTNAPILVTPEDNEELEYYSGVELNWDDVEYADEYIVNTAINSDFNLFNENYLSSTSEMFLQDFLPNTTYYWRVKAVNSYKACNDWSPVYSFTTGDETTNNHNLLLNTNVEIRPNIITSQDNCEIFIRLSEAQNVDYELINIRGERVLGLVNKPCYEGENTIMLATDKLENGLFILQLDLGKEIVTRRLIINR